MSRGLQRKAISQARIARFRERSLEAARAEAALALGRVAELERLTGHGRTSCGACGELTLADPANRRTCSDGAERVFCPGCVWPLSQQGTIEPEAPKAEPALLIRRFRYALDAELLAADMRLAGLEAEVSRTLDGFVDVYGAEGIAYANDIGGGQAYHCPGCHRAVLDEPANAGVDCVPVRESRLEAGARCEVCSVEIRPSAAGREALLAMDRAAALQGRYREAQPDVMAVLEAVAGEPCLQDVLNPCDLSGGLSHWGGLSPACRSCQARVLVARIAG